ncbi:hypothetical protein AB0F72_08525 [Actinoplanes sp. NPDC023936]|uniref:hypothetical protein n=1 Tax=Actinoplanes sp. NPDC023936 TaxID=3154910 RepID=UPI0033EDC204
MSDVYPTPERLDVAHRASGRNWTFGPIGPVEIDHNGALRVMVGAGLIKPHYVTPEQQLAGQNDYYRLTEAGERWLAENEENA